MIKKEKNIFYKGIVKDIVYTVWSEEVGKGQYQGQFEKEFAQYLGSKEVIAVCSMRQGLSCLLEGLNLKKGDEIILPAYASKELFLAFLSMDYKLRFVDVEKSSFNIDPGLLEKAITPQSKVILVSHLFGLPCDIENILGVAKKYGLKIIEDCSQAHGAELNKRKVGTFGDAGIFSLEADCPLNAFGGCAITTDNLELACAIRNKVKILNDSAPKFSSSLKALKKISMNFIKRILVDSPFNSFFSGRNNLSRPICKGAMIEGARFTNLQALIGIKQLRLLDSRNQQRDQLAAEFDKVFGNNVITQKSAFSGKRVYYSYVVSLSPSNIDLLKEKLFKKGIEAGIKEELACDCGIFYKKETEYPVSTFLYNSNLQLPMFIGLGNKEISYIAKAIRESFSEKE